MITGTINENLEPLIDDIFIEGKNGWIALRTILDTGFNGAFSLPRQYAEQVELEFLCDIDAELSDGTIITDSIYMGTILVKNQPYVVEISLTDSETAVMGMAMLLEKEIVFNLRLMTIEVT